ncbi:MAG: TRAP-type C4-dicarboxylate transport system permease small subunit [Paracoccaceae bacterium]|jgi:TRAP-type C4-dicarboxylate transport system permease small subunit
MYHFFYKISRIMTYLGGAMLSALIVLTGLSVAGRSLNGFLHSDWMDRVAPGFADWALGTGVGPINGDFELIEAGIAFAVFAFLPLCQLTGGHASVDVFTNLMSDRVNRALRLITEILFAAVLVLIAVQLFAGMQSKFRSGQTTFLVEFPVWWAYALSLIGAVVAAAVGVYVAVTRLRETVTGQQILPVDLGADH